MKCTLTRFADVCDRTQYLRHLHSLVPILTKSFFITGPTALSGVDQEPYFPRESKLVREPNIFFLRFVAQILVRKLFFHLKEAILHLYSENQCWTCQFLVASDTYAIELRPRMLRPCETMSSQVKIEETN